MTSSSSDPHNGSEAQGNGTIAAAEDFSVYLLNQPLQIVCIVCIILLAVGLNVLVIHNISCNELKLRSVNFILIRNLCLVDLLGALLILPVPLIVTAMGGWSFSPSFCTANSMVNLAIWFQHIALFAFIKVDRLFASCLPIGRYPLLSVEVVKVLVAVSWIVGISTAVAVPLSYKVVYESAVALCIPDLPTGFFIAIFSVYCLILTSMVTGMIGTVVHLKKKQARINNQNGMLVVNYKGVEKTALASFLVTVSHFLLYVPTMLVIGLRGWFLPKFAILICDMIVYAEFLIHPVVLLMTSTRMRSEIGHTLRRLAGRTAGGGGGGGTGCSCSSWATGRIGHDQSVRDTEDKTQEEEGDGCSPKSLHKLNQNLEHSSTATSAVGLPPTPPDDLDDADNGGGGGCLFRNGNPPLLSSPSSAGSISEKHHGLLASVSVEKYSRTEEVDSGAASGGDNFLDTSAAIDFAAVLNVRALDADEDKVRAIPMSSNGPWTKYGASAGGGALEDSGSTALSSALFSQSQTSADIVDIIRTVRLEGEAQMAESSEKVMNGFGAPLAEKEVVSPTETILTRSELVNGFEKKLD